MPVGNIARSLLIIVSAAVTLLYTSGELRPAQGPLE
jgi:hypothetical protein